MLRTLTAGLALLCAAPVATAQAITPWQPGQEDGTCLFTGTPPADFAYVTVRKLEYGKGSYGSVNDLLPKLVQDVRSAGGDAVIHYNGAQRFGFFPWRFVRPVVTGSVIKWSPARTVDCAAAGGHYTTGSLEEAPAVEK